MPQNKGDAVPARAAGANAPEPASRLGLSAASTIAGYTPGPWEREPQGKGARGHWLQDRNGEYVGLVCRRNAGRAEEDANARLMVAAPALVEALQEAQNVLLDAFMPDGIYPDDVEAVLTKADAALTLALGEQS